MAIVEPLVSVSDFVAFDLQLILHFVEFVGNAANLIVRLDEGEMLLACCLGLVDCFHQLCERLGNQMPVGHHRGDHNRSDRHSEKKQRLTDHRPDAAHNPGRIKMNREFSDLGFFAINFMKNVFDQIGVMIVKSGLVVMVFVRSQDQVVLMIIDENAKNTFFQQYCFRYAGNDTVVIVPQWLGQGRSIRV